MRFLTPSLMLLPFRSSALVIGPNSTTTAPVAGATTTVDNTDPGHAVVIDNTSHAIPTNSSRWYSFGYAGDRSQITVTLVNGSNSGLAFNVFTPAEIVNRWDATPVGRGTSYAINCTTGLPQEGGRASRAT